MAPMMLPDTYPTSSAPSQRFTKPRRHPLFDAVDALAALTKKVESWISEEPEPTRPHRRDALPHGP